MGSQRPNITYLRHRSSVPQTDGLGLTASCWSPLHRICSPPRSHPPPLADGTGSERVHEPRRKPPGGSAYHIQSTQSPATSHTKTELRTDSAASEATYVSEDQVCFGISDEHVCAVTLDQFGLKSNEDRILQRGRGPQIASNAQCHVVMPLLERRDCTCKHTEVSTQGEANPPSYR